jgi:hypothetical protein
MCWFSLCSYLNTVQPAAMKKILPLLLLPLAFAGQCKKTDLSELPPATQTGANTFGCLVNGKAFLPSGYDGSKPNFKLVIDPAFQNGNFDLIVYRLVNDKYESISFFSNNIKAVGTYNIHSGQNLYFDYINDITNCKYLFSNDTYSDGVLKINKYDLITGIFSGEFECKVFDQTTSCDTIRITNGRFDKKL